ncbi:MAG: class I SAM-dependent methyltransferase [Pseudomonadota bacterium]
MGHRKEIHDRVLNAKDTKALISVYDEWADHYDHDLLNEMGYPAPASAVQLLLSHLQDHAARILDAGCGTGLVGELLKQQGCQQIDGLDYSEAMLAKASSKNIYQALFQEDLMGTLTLAADKYDALISVGTFSCGHVKSKAFSELIRVTKPGGYICATIREQAWDEENYDEAMAALESGGYWKLLETQIGEYIQQEGSRCKICLYQVN